MYLLTIPPLPIIVAIILVAALAIIGMSIHTSKAEPGPKFKWDPVAKVWYYVGFAIINGSVFSVFCISEIKEGTGFIKEYSSRFYSFGQAIQQFRLDLKNAKLDKMIKQAKDYEKGRT